MFKKRNKRVSALIMALVMILSVFCGAAAYAEEQSGAPEMNASRSGDVITVTLDAAADLRFGAFGFFYTPADGTELASEPDYNDSVFAADFEWNSSQMKGAGIASGKGAAAPSGTNLFTFVNNVTEGFKPDTEYVFSLDVDEAFDDEDADYSWVGSTISVTYVEYTLTFINGEETVDTLYVIGGNTAAAPEMKEKRVGYSFDGWKDADGADFSENNPVTESKTYEAQWTAVEYNISYDLDGGVNSSSNPATYTIEDAVTFSDPTKEGSTFKGWIDADGNAITGIAAGSTGDVSITATWEENTPEPEPEPETFTVTFDSNGGSEVDAQTVESGKTASKPEDPTKEGSTFKYWTLDGKEYDFGSEVTDNITLVAEWEQDEPEPKPEIVTFTVTFDSNGGSKVDPQTVESGKPVSKPKNPTFSGYKFKGWQLDGNDYDFSAPVTADITLKAVWEKSSSGGGSGGSSSRGESSEKFTDVPKDAWYHDAVYWAVDKGITKGTSSSTFSPNLGTTRADFVRFVYRASGSPEVEGELPFTDVKKSDDYYNAVLWAWQQGITKGTSDTEFSPSWVITRGQALTMLYRRAGEPEIGFENPFTDVQKEDYFYNAILWAVNKKITTGTSETEFSPNRNSYRAEIVTFLYRELKDVI